MPTFDWLYPPLQKWLRKPLLCNNFSLLPVLPPSTLLRQLERSSDKRPFIVLNLFVILHPQFFFTSSTAQGGGGSFKNMKPIGEVGCCESRMAQRSHWWIERWLMSPLFLSSLSPSIHPSIHPSIYLSICKLENQAIPQDFFICQSWQHQKRSNSARLPHFSTLTTSNTKQFSETSSMFARDNVKDEAILRKLLHFSKLTTSKTKQFCEIS